MNRRGLLRSIFGLGLSLLGFGYAPAAQAYKPGDLPGVEAWVRDKYKDVQQLSTERLASALNGGDVIVFDVREPDEYAVSHIRNAVQIDPGTWSSRPIEKMAGDLKGKAVVFYCSVGVRSSQLAERIQAELRRRGATEIYNLEGGLFRWHNEGRAVVNANGPTDKIHPYDQKWGRLIERSNLATTGRN